MKDLQITLELREGGPPINVTIKGKRITYQWEQGEEDHLSMLELRGKGSPINARTKEKSITYTWIPGEEDHLSMLELRKRGSPITTSLQNYGEEDRLLL